MASGSASEFETLISIGAAVGYLPPDALRDLGRRIDGIKRMLHGLAASLSEASGSTGSDAP